MYAANRNILYAQIFVDELARCGLEHVCIAPGSRNTPLVIAFHENPHIRVHSHLDERSAAFFALGIGLETGKPAALICSSGTAGANFYPAVIEARYNVVPMIVITADRPPELRHSGANQTIDQVNMFGEHVLWSVDMGLPEANPPDVSLRNLRTTAARAYHTARGELNSAARGAVHINMPFRKPLEPIPVESDHTGYDEPIAPIMFINGASQLNTAQILQLSQMVTAAKRGLIICGPRCTGDNFPEAVLRLSHASGFPILADPLSGVRYGLPENVISTYDTFIRAAADWGAPDIVIHFGAAPTSQPLMDYLNTTPPQIRLVISADGVWRDPDHRSTHFVHADPTHTAQALAAEISQSVMTLNAEWVNLFYTTERILRDKLNTALKASLFDGSAVSTVMRTLPENTRVLVGNSLPVRHVDQFGFARPERLHIYGNRGASGIDGNISTALGIAASKPEAPTVLIIGDIAFYHDLNGLLAVKRDKIANITIVLINNDGGGIFNRLPIANFDPPFTDLFLTPHGLDFEPAIRMYGLEYTRVESFTTLEQQLIGSISRRTPTVIEIRTDSKADHQRRLEINREAAAHLASILSELN